MEYPACVMEYMTYTLYCFYYNFDIFVFVIVILGPHPVVFRNNSCLCVQETIPAGSGDHMGYYKLNLGWLCAIHISLLLYYYSSPNSDILST